MLKAQVELNLLKEYIEVFNTILKRGEKNTSSEIDKKVTKEIMMVSADLYSSLLRYQRELRINPE